MKKHEIGKIEDGTYTVYNNLDEKLKAEIVAFKPDLTTVEIGCPTGNWTIIEKIGNEYKCQSGKNIHYFSEDDVNRGLNATIQKQINNKFIPVNYFTNCFGVLSKTNENYLSVINITGLYSSKFILEEINNITEYDSNNMNTISDKYEYQIKTHNEIILQCRKTLFHMFLYFTPEGNYANRDYNINISQYNQETISPVTIFNNFKNEIYKHVGENILEFNKNIYYTKDFCYIPYLFDESDNFFNVGVDIIKSRNPNDNSYQNYKGDTIFKKPKKTTEKTIDDLWLDIENLLLPKHKNLLNDNFLN